MGTHRWPIQRIGFLALAIGLAFLSLFLLLQCVWVLWDLLYPVVTAEPASSYGHDKDRALAIPFLVVGGIFLKWALECFRKAFPRT